MLSTNFTDNKVLILHTYLFIVGRSLLKGKGAIYTESLANTLLYSRSFSNVIDVLLCIWIENLNGKQCIMYCMWKSI